MQYTLDPIWSSILVTLLVNYQRQMVSVLKPYWFNTGGKWSVVALVRSTLTNGHSRRSSSMHISSYLDIAKVSRGADLNFLMELIQYFNFFKTRCIKFWELRLMINCLFYSYFFLSIALLIFCSF